MPCYCVVYPLTGPETQFNMEFQTPLTSPTTLSGVVSLSRKAAAIMLLLFQKLAMAAAS
jgi:hypothetical protein